MKISSRTVCAVGVVTGGLVFALLSCTTPADHNNPLDPESPGYTTKGRITGRVTTYYQPYLALPGATVELTPTATVVRTDAEGTFAIDNLEPGTYFIAASADSHQATRDTVQVAARSSIPVELRLNGLPIIDAVQARSERISTREAAADRLVLEISATLRDVDGPNDIRRVEFSAPAQAFTDTLRRAAGQAQWSRQFFSVDLPGVDFTGFIGTAMHLVAEDFPGARVTSDAFFLARIISQVPVALSPAHGDTIRTAAPILLWQVQGVEFPHKIRVEVFALDAGFPRFITSVSNIAPGTTNIKYPGRLSTGNYFWTITIIDNFGNTSRSKEAFFRTEN